MNSAVDWGVVINWHYQSQWTNTVWSDQNIDSGIHDTRFHSLINF